MASEGSPKTLNAFLNVSLGFIKEKIYPLPIKSASLKSLDHHSYNSNNDFIAFRCAVFYWAECFPASRNVKTCIQLPFKRQLQVSWGYSFPVADILRILLPNHNHWSVISTGSPSVHPTWTFSFASSWYRSWNSSCKDERLYLPHVFQFWCVQKNSRRFLRDFYNKSCIQNLANISPWAALLFQGWMRSSPGKQMFLITDQTLSRAWPARPLESSSSLHYAQIFSQTRFQVVTEI